jgi:hypothetical protein
MMHQSARHEVLSNLGLRSWYCKYTLTNAAKTPDNIVINVKLDESFPVESDKTLIKTSVSLESTNPAAVILSSIQDVSPSVSELDIKLDAENLDPIHDEDLNNESSLIAKPPLIGIPVTELILTAVAFDKIVVLYEKPVSDDSVLEKDLLENIIRALTERQVEHRAKESVFSWPVFKSSALIKEQSVYFDKLTKRWLEQQCWLECRYVLYFGENCSSLDSMIMGVRDEQSLDFILVPFKYSLFHLLNSPIKKKNLWGLFSSLGISCD